MKKVCIVTPDIMGVMTNGGIGTACYWLALFYAKISDCDVTVIYTMPINKDDNSTDFEHATKKNNIVDSFFKKNIKFILLENIPSRHYNVYPHDNLLNISDIVYHYCAKENFDVIHFQDLNSGGFRSFQAKRLGLAFDKTLLTLTMHSPFTWIRQGMSQFPQYPLVEGRLDYTTQYSAKHADVLISPSQYMFDWCLQNNWKLQDNRQVIPNLLEHPLEKGMISFGDEIDFSHIVFFARIETRKGLDIFCQSMRSLCEKKIDHGIKKITFLGKENYVGTHISSAYLIDFVQHISQFGISFKNIYHYNSFEALQYLKESRAIAVMPSLLDNYPYTVIECMQHRIPFLASRVGGVPEMVCDDVLFEPTEEALSAALMSRYNHVQKSYCRYSLSDAQNQWKNMLYQQVDVNKKQINKKPLVSICITYSNHGKYLPYLLESIIRNDYVNLEVIVVDDASTCTESRNVFAQQKKKYAYLNWQFIQKDHNDDVGATQNQAVAASRGDYIIIMDANNFSKPNMVSHFVRGMQLSNADCLTCFSEYFTGEGIPPENYNPTYMHAPYGASLEMGILENAFGGTNCCIKRDVFIALGGFTTNHHQSFEYWQFFKKLSLLGYTLDVIPETLFLYCHMPDSFIHSTNDVSNIKRATHIYLQHKFWDLEKIIYNILLPLNGEVDNNNQELMRTLDNMKNLEKSLEKSNDFLRKSKEYATELHHRYQSLSHDLAALQNHKNSLLLDINQLKDLQCVDEYKDMPHTQL